MRFGKVDIRNMAFLLCHCPELTQRLPYKGITHCARGTYQVGLDIAARSEC